MDTQPPWPRAQAHARGVLCGDMGGKERSRTKPVCECPAVGWREDPHTPTTRSARGRDLSVSGTEVEGRRRLSPAALEPPRPGPRAPRSSTCFFTNTDSGWQGHSEAPAPPGARRQTQAGTRRRLGADRNFLTQAAFMDSCCFGGGLAGPFESILISFLAVMRPSMNCAVSLLICR